MKFYPNKPGSHYDKSSNKLYLFRGSTIHVLRGYPEPYSWRKTPKGGWSFWVDPRFFLDHARLVGENRQSFADFLQDPSFLGLDPISLQQMNLLPVGDVRRTTMQRRLAFRKYLASFPGEVLTRVRNYPEWQFLMMMYLSRSAHAKELADSNPALAFMLASNRRFHAPRVRQPMRAARSWAKRRRVDIMRWLGVFEHPRAMEKILRRVDPIALTTENLVLLQNVMQRAEGVRLLIRQQFQRLSTGLIHLLEDEEFLWVAHPDLLHELALSKSNRVFPRVPGMLRDVLNMADMMGVKFSRREFRSIAQVQWVHEELANGGRWAVEMYRRKPFPPAPMKPKAGWIRPLVSPKDVADAARRFRNCAWGRLPDIYRGNEYLYEISHDVGRAMVSLVRKSGRWTIGEIRGRNNTPVKHELLREVNRALCQVHREKAEHPESNQTALPFDEHSQLDSA